MKRSGFTLIELMIVVAIIAIIAAIAIPSLLTARKAAHEASAIASLRTVSSTQEQYHSRFGAYGDLSQLLAEQYIDPALGSGTKSGYSFSIVSADADTWACVAVPTTPGTTGDRGFYVDQVGVIRFTPDGSAPNGSSAPVGN
ncbi:MAG: type IV pilin protein [Planctomycetota bacterium]|jgi:prepilin-type N-terminal cleavage/methylation domain-containing protein